ncbi:kinase-like protein, partial [Macrolepiota fuliginosa MF-IS2]
NRILVILCKLATSARVYPQRFVLEALEYDTEAVTGGGFATVHKGRYHGRSVCVKILFDRVGKKVSHKLLQECIKELILWAHLSHPNILPFYGVFGGDSRIRLVSPWMANGTICEYSRRLPQVSRMPLISDVVDGLLYLHKLNIVHSDLKGANVLISDRGRAFITDFGISHIATVAGRQQFTSSLIGNTARWAPPETFDQDPEVPIRPTKAQDIWSFGCLCYEVLSRKPPFHQYRTERLSVVAIIGGEIPLRPGSGHDPDWDDISDQMWTLMESCWSHTPEDRPTFQYIRGRFAEMDIQDDSPGAPGRIGDDLILGRSVELDENRVVGILLSLLSRIDATLPTFSATSTQQQPPTHSPGASWESEPLGQDQLPSKQSPSQSGPILIPDSSSAPATTRTSAPKPRLLGAPGAYVQPHTPVPGSFTFDHGRTQPDEQQPAPCPPPKGTLDAVSPLPSHLNAPFVQSPPIPPIPAAQADSTVQIPPKSSSIKKSSPIADPVTQAKGSQAGVSRSLAGATEATPLRRPQNSLQSPEPTPSPPQGLPPSASTSSLAPTSAPLTRTPLTNGPNHSRSRLRALGRSLSAAYSTTTPSTWGSNTNVGTGIPTEKLRSEDIIIAVMGPTGTGKSHFIDVLTRSQPGTRSGHKLGSHTGEVQCTILKGYEGNRSLVLVDTPGFDDTEKSDMEILDMISKWLEKT